MKVDLRYPVGEPVEIDSLLASLTDEPVDGRLTVGDERVVEFLLGMSRKLLAPSLARRFPELASLGFFLRKAELRRTVERLQAATPDALVMPRGLVFHVPPANVDTIFVYSWALSALAGNANVIRVSARSAGAATAILDALNDTDAHPAIAQTQRMITYGRDDEITAALSRACDLRVIWGGDRTVHEIRRHPLAAAARDVTFPDRTSFAVVSIAGWQAADARTRALAAEGLVNDVYWFDQAACASPRAVFLVGDPAGADAVRVELVSLVEKTLRDRSEPALDAAMAVEKRVGVYGLAADGAADRITFHGNEVTDVELTGPGAMPRHWLGTGVFAFANVAQLADLVPLIRRKDQTLSHFGFDAQELTGFARAVAGRGVDRMVPFGQALAFAGIWDGYDLSREFTRLVTITT
ncbi:hypothetical protein F4553_003224 [Allocatelliglobosispora scoriae]|uniref:Long-chain-fatty-acyl-CoA reductase n=1 Tax=Allocatelliglobosispora scoriae TaxID=643052 RepID=A0A841BQ73_9ACTN|nr:acyl-CoA reductase [Allocatelliglobosispora scoriae]MBB5869845.1 hypothetical protein [Allocatelliglobosispora scoriae]